MRKVAICIQFILFIFGVAASGGRAAAQSGAPADPVVCAREMTMEAEILKSRQNSSAIETAAAAGPSRALNLGVARAMASRFYRPRSGEANGKAALVVHGFMASPFEVEALSERLAADGYVVWAPLIYGFGATAEVANRATIEDFRRTIDDGMDLLARCHSEIAVAGFSFGGSLVTDFLFRGVDADGAYVSPAHPERAARVTSAALLAPYYSPWEHGEHALAFLRRSATWRPVLPMWMIALVSSDVRAARLYPAYYLSEMPLRAVVTLLDFSPRFEAIAASGARSRVPATLAFSAGDRTVDWPMAERYVPARFERSDVIKIPAIRGVPHQLLIPTLNPRWRDAVDAIAKRLERPEIIGGGRVEILNQK